MTKPSRWAHGTFLGQPWRWSRRGHDDDIDGDRQYYRRLCLYYISEARRWRMIARDNDSETIDYFTNPAVKEAVRRGLDDVYRPTKRRKR